MGDERFVLVSDAHAVAAAAEALFDRLRADLQAVLPAGTSIEHVGATSAPGCETKGDLDLVIRVAPIDFEQARAILDARLCRNEGSVRTDSFAAYVDERQTLSVGFQLVTRGSEFDVFTAFRDALRADPELVQRYNALKRAHDGQDADVYRAAKAAFVDAALKAR